MLETLVALLAAAVIFVPLSRHFGFGSVLGYLVAGAAIGPSGLRLISDVDVIAQVSELGVIMLLFLIGLELRPHRLWVMRRAIFGLGAGQVIITAAAIAGLLHLCGVDWTTALVLGCGLALSSTAIVLPMLAEHNLLNSTAGRDSFAVLLFQDLAFIPLVALVPLLAGGAMPLTMPWIDVAGAVAAIAVILLGGRYLVRPVFKAVGGVKTPEVFTATALLVVVGTASIAHVAGLSTSLGAFLAGVLLSDSEYRHELEADIAPFEGLLLGFFFMSVGMSADLALAASQPLIVFAGVAALILLKFSVTFGLGIALHQDLRTTLRFSLALPQGGEFGFVILAAAVGAGALTQSWADQATLVIALSMVAGPMLFTSFERWIAPRLAHREAPPVYDTIEPEGTAVVICGFGRMGQIIGRVLRMRGIPFTALDKNAAQVEVLRRFGNKVYYGDPTRLELLRAAGADTARLLVIALDDMEETLRLVDNVRRHFPKLKILSRARNRRHVHLLLDRGVDEIVRETLFSSLKMSELVLQDLGIPGPEARRAVELFHEHDERNLKESHAFYEDETLLIQSAQHAASELSTLFEADRTGNGSPPPTEAKPPS
jgi:monovalent cation:proton antiporter-2 (CPA2) family protein